MAESWNIEWLNSNSGRAYPFREGSELEDDGGLIRIPNSFLVDFVMVTPYDKSSDIYLSKMARAGGSVMMSFSSSDGPVASASVDESSDRNIRVEFGGQGEYVGCRGSLVIGDFDDFSRMISDGVYAFDGSAAVLERRTTRPDIRGVRSLRVRRADGTRLEGLTGLVDLVAGSNIRLTVVPSDGILPPAVRIDSMATNLEEECECDTNQTRPDPIRTINGVPPDESGNIDLTPVSSCIDISASEGEVRFDDKCSEPCCGCEELEFLTDKLNVLNASVEVVSSRSERLREILDAFRTAVLSSR